MNTSNWEEIFNAIPLPCLLIKPLHDGSFMIEKANNSYMELTGTTAEDLLGKKSEEAFPRNPEGPQHGNDLLQKTLVEVMQKGKKINIDSFRFDIPVRGTNRFEERYWSNQNIPLKNASGEVEYILHTVQDITRQWNMEKREKELQTEIDINRQQYRNFIRENPDGLYRLDLQGNFLHANEGLAKLAELPLEKILKMDFLPFCAPHHKEQILEKFQRATQGETLSFEADFISANGTPLILKILLMPMTIDGKVTEVHGIAKDISGLRESEKIVMEKSRFLEVNAAFISSLLENELEDKALFDTFEIIAKTVEADRMYYFGADKHPETGEILISQKVEWCSEDTSIQLDNPDMQDMPIKK
ncbi:MAG TPA: PAS domain S-box protein, partial [Salinimicrobium catena]|nr:PAS domain S-box protein [Salinimicrobium catena]